MYFYRIILVYKEIFLFFEGNNEQFLRIKKSRIFGSVERDKRDRFR